MRNMVTFILLSADIYRNLVFPWDLGAIRTKSNEYSCLILLQVDTTYSEMIEDLKHHPDDKK